MGVVGCLVSEILVIIVVFSCIPRKGYSEVAIIVIIVDAPPKTVLAYLIDVVLNPCYLDGSRGLPQVYGNNDNLLVMLFSQIVKFLRTLRFVSVKCLGS